MASSTQVASVSRSGPSLQRAARISFQLAGVCGLIAAILGIHVWVAMRRVTSADRNRARTQATAAAQGVNTELVGLSRVVDSIAGAIDAGQLGRPQLGDRFQTAMDTLPQLIGIGTAYLPYAYDPDLRLYAPYYRRTADGGSERIGLDSLYDYTASGQEWYQAALRAGRGWWSEPSLGEDGSVVEYSEPFREATTPGAAPQTTGVVHGTLSLTDVANLIRSLDIGEYGYGFLISPQGAVISHPLKADWIQESGDAGGTGPSRAGLKGMLDAAVRMHPGEFMDAIDPVTRKPAMLVTEKAPASGWIVGVVFLKRAGLRDKEYRRELMQFTVALLLALFLLVVAGVLRWSHRHLKYLWAGVLLGSGLLLMGIGTLWYEGYGAPSASASSAGTVFSNAADVHKFFIDTTRAALKQNDSVPVFIPTGVMVQTLEVLGPNNLLVSGFIWEKYGNNLPADISRGVTLPEASDSSVTEAYRRKQPDGEVVGWQFKATIRQSFDYSKYPLDQQTFRLRLRHPDFDKGIVLVPDLDSYPIINPQARPGLEATLTLPGWIVDRTQFSADTSETATSYGLGGAESPHELVFNVVMNRQIVEPILSSLLPLAVSAFMVFVLLLVIGEGTRFKAVPILSACSALFFVIILSELDIRRRLASSSIMYIEYFYFVTYGAILIVALLTLSNAFAGMFPRVEHREFLVPKLLFWPAVLSVVLAVTLVIFY